jgi:hypothetical protein
LPKIPKIQLPKIPKFSIPNFFKFGSNSGKYTILPELTYPPPKLSYFPKFPKIQLPTIPKIPLPKIPKITIPKFTKILKYPKWKHWHKKTKILNNEGLYPFSPKKSSTNRLISIFNHPVTYYIAYQLTETVKKVLYAECMAQCRFTNQEKNKPEKSQMGGWKKGFLTFLAFIWLCPKFLNIS